MAKGNITKMSHGSFTEVAKDDHTAVARNVHIDASGKINQNAKQGINYGEPNKRNGSKSEFINVIIGVFFDGTSNNRVNADSKEKNPDSYKSKDNWFSTLLGSNTSYKNDHTNVDLLQKIYPNVPNEYFSIYVEGIGTADQKGDYTLGQVFGKGKTGIPDRVKDVCSRISDKLLKYTNNSNQKINKIIIDVFGFSRGSAAARYFVNEISKQATDEILHFSVNSDKQYYISPYDHKVVYLSNPPKSYISDPNKPLLTKSITKHGYLGHYLHANKIDFIDLDRRFAGLFDSVSSYGYNHKNDVEELHQNGINQMKHIVHITAADEHREKFESTHVTKGIELHFPGVHSDIGGGYKDAELETVALTKKSESVLELVGLNEMRMHGMSDQADKIENKFNKDRKEAFEKERLRLIEQAWYLPGQINNSLEDRLIGKRTLSNKYSLIPLNVMIDFCTLKCTIPFNKTIIKTEYTISPKDEILTDALKRLRLYSFKNNNAPVIYYTEKELLKYKKQLDNKEISIDDYNLKVKDHNLLRQLRNKYLHWSADFDSIGMSPHINANGERQRVIYNLPANK